MNTPNTPVHIHLWHRDFWLLVLSALLLTMAVYVLIPVLPQWFMQEENFTPEETGLSIAAFALGLYVFGAHCSWLVQHYRRNVVFMWAVFGVALDAGLLWYINSLRCEFVELWIILLQRFFLGAAYGLAQMVLMSTLIIDTSESAQRTEANYFAAWFSRFALATGPLAGLLLYQYEGFDGMVGLSVGCAVVALLLIKTVNFPFRTPDDKLRVTSLDRFFLVQGGVLFVHLLFIALVVGLLLSIPHDMLFYGLMAVGFLLAMLAQQFVFPEAELKSEVISGLIMLFATAIILLFYPSSPVAPVLMGLGTGLVGSRFLLFFIKLSRHCQRGTSQSTFFLAWETGLTLGIALGYGLFYEDSLALYYTAMMLTVLSLLAYHLFTHQWFLQNKNR